MESKIPYKGPQMYETSFNCPHCNAFSKIDWSDVAISRNRTIINNLKIAVCEHCENFSLWYEESLIFPSIIPVELPNQDLPEEIKRDYEEAAKIVNVSPRGASALLRLAIQKLCGYLGEDGKNINNDIASLVEKGLPKRIQKALDTVRVVGNEAVHPGVLEMSDNNEIAFALFKLVNIITEKMISEEREIDEIYQSLPQEKLDQIKERDNK